MTRLSEALQRAHALREQNRLGLQADAPACRLEEAPLPPLPPLPPLVDSEIAEMESPPRASEGMVRVAIFAAAGLILVLIFAWYFVASRETPPPAKPPSILKLEYELKK